MVQVKANGAARRLFALSGRKIGLVILLAILCSVAYGVYSYFPAVRYFGVDRTKEYPRRSGEVEISFVENNRVKIQNPFGNWIKVMAYRRGSPRDLIRVPGGSVQNYPVAGDEEFFIYDDKGVLIGFIRLS